jgi:hypothetical protein
MSCAAGAKTGRTGPNRTDGGGAADPGAARSVPCSLRTSLCSSPLNGYSKRVAALYLLILLILAVCLWRMATNRRTAPVPTRLLAPDDDPDFLRELDRRSRRADDDPV